MKIQTILSENFSAMVDAKPVLFSDLTTLQIRTLRRIAAGQVDIENANDNEYEIITDLADLGLLDQEYQLTKRGTNAVAIADKLGGSSELLDARRRQEKMDASGEKNSMSSNTDDLENDTEIDPIGNGDDEFDFNVDNTVERGVETNRGRLNF